MKGSRLVWLVVAAIKGIADAFIGRPLQLNQRRRSTFIDSLKVAQQRKPSFSHAAARAPLKSASADDYVEIFRDDFEFLNRTLWNFEVGDGTRNDGWGNWEKQYYTYSPKNAFCQDSILHVRALKEEDGIFGWTSARLNTAGIFNFTYGLLQARIRVPHQAGPFSAVWALSEKESDPAVRWPLCGEIDIFEMNTLWNYTPATLHFQDHNAGNALSYHDFIPNLDDWHVYGMEWTPDYIRFLHDGKEVGRYDRPENATMNNWPYNDDNPFYLIINNAMKPSWGSEIAEDLTEHTLQVDWISVSQKAAWQ